MQMLQSRTHNAATSVVNLHICVHNIPEQDMHMDITLHNQKGHAWCFCVSHWYREKSNSVYFRESILFIHMVRDISGYCIR